MKLLSSFSLVAISCLLLVSCSKKSDAGNDDDDLNPPGSTRSVTVDITYVSGLIENSTSYATWPVAVFPVDGKAVSYKVRLYGFSGTFVSPPEGKITIWKAGDTPPTDYNVYASTKGIKDGKYYFTIGRTWCSGCDKANPAWLDNYKKGWGNPKAEITYQY
jgi:hypothetical protein